MTSLEKIKSRKKETKADLYSVGDQISLGLKGLYRVEDTIEMEISGTTCQTYILSDIFSSTLHKMFLPLQQATKISRELSVFDGSWDSILDSFKLDPIEPKWNSNKKILGYEKRVLETGFRGLVESFLNVKYDLETNTKTDKRYFAFKERLSMLIMQEMTISMDIPMTKAEEIFRVLNQHQTSH